MRNRQLSATLVGALLCSLAAAMLSSFVRAQSSAAFTPPSDADAMAGALSATQGWPQRQAALEGLRALAEHLPGPASSSQADRIFNIDDHRMLRQATLGEGFEMYLVDPRALLSGKRLDRSLYGSGEWRFVVIADGKSVGLVTVARTNGKWTMVEAGASELAGEVAAVAARYAQHAPDARLRFVRSRQAVADFIEVSPPATAASAPSPVYVPLGRAGATFAHLHPDAAAPASTLSDTELGDALRQRVRRGMNDPRFGH